MEAMDEDTPASSTSGSRNAPPSGAPRPGTPAKHPASAATALSSGAAAPPSASSKRRRGLGVVTPNACTECRKKRAKCDGQRPCSRCRAQKGAECVYEIPIRQSKENLRVEIEQLRRQQDSSDSVFAALVRPELWEEVLQRLRNGRSVDEIAEWLGLGGTLPSGGGGAIPAFTRAIAGQSANITSLGGFSGAATAGFTPVASGLAPMNQTAAAAAAGGLRPHEADQASPWGGGGPFSSRSSSHPDTMSWSADNRGMPPQSRVGSWVEDMGQDQAAAAAGEGHRYRGLDQVLAPEMPEMKVPASTWTTITADSYLVQHLLALYFCWEYPTFASLSKEHFLKDFQDGRERYCSPMLVNALLALGCRFSSQPSTRANPDDPYTSGDHFFKESQRLLYHEKNHHTLTTIQALGIMSIREASCGRDSESWYYAGQSIRLAVEMGLHRLHGADGDGDEMAVKAATFWGAFALDHAWSLATGSLPQSSCFAHLPPKPAIIDDIEASLWIPYTDDGAPLQRSCEQPSNVRSVYKCFCELSELVHQSLYMLHSPGRPLTSRDLLNIYTQYLNWYDRIPEVLRLGHNFTPAVLFAHMYYHFAILLLFRPLIKLRILGSSITPRDVCSQAADAIQGLLRSYSQLYTLRRTPSFVPYFVLTSSIMHLTIGAAKAVKAVAATAPMVSPMVVSPEGQDNTPPGTVQGQGQGKQQKQQHRQEQPQRQHQRQQEQKQKQKEVPDLMEQAAAVAAKMDPKVKEAIKRGIADLTEMAPCHHFALQALNILRYLAKKWQIDVDLDDGSEKGEETETTPPGPAVGEPEKAARGQGWDQKRLVDDAASGVRPMTTSLNFFAPNVMESDFICNWGGPLMGAAAAASATASATAAAGTVTGIATGDSGGGQQQQQQQQQQQPFAQAAASMENPLFWPFPMQGRPILPSGQLLHEAGFALL